MGAGSICSRNRDIVNIGNLSPTSVSVPPDSNPSIYDIFVEETYEEGGGPVV